MPPSEYTRRETKLLLSLWQELRKGPAMIKLIEEIRKIEFEKIKYDQENEADYCEKTLSEKVYIRIQIDKESH